MEVWGFFSSCGQLFADIINAVIVQTINGLKHGAVDKKEIIVKGEDEHQLVFVNVGAFNDLKCLFL